MGTIEDRDAAYIWLRQSAELTLGDQRRTLEIAVPVRLGATPDEIARLLDEAEAGMQRLAERMDRQVAAVRDAAPATRQSATPSTRPITPPARPVSGIAERPATTTGAAATASPARPTTPASTPSSQPTTSGPMARAEFLEQARILGQSPRQVMDRLSVRTLEGLNYIEALEQIKRQLLREQTQAPQGTAPAAPNQAAAPATAPTPEPEVVIEPPTARGPVSYFDEEDEYDVTFELPEDGADADALDAEPTDVDEAPRTPEPAAPTRRGAQRPPTEHELDDVPDFAEPRPAARAEPPAKARPSVTPDTGPVEESPAPSRPAVPASHQALAQRARAHDLLARLREYRGGSPAGSDQVGAFTNVVIEQLGEPTVASLTDQVWGIGPADLSAQQMRALIQWGKTDAFATEVVAVLDLLATEQTPDVSSETKAPAARTGRPTAARPAARGTGSAH